MSDITSETTKEPANRRDFLTLATSGMAAVGAASFGWTLIDSMNPAADVKPLHSDEFDLSEVKVGQSKTVQWRDWPVFVRHRTPIEIKAAEAGDAAAILHPQKDSKRVLRPEWLVILGVCTYRGCIPLGQKNGQLRGEYNGWFCPCCASHFDTSGRVRKGPAPENMIVPPYEFSSKNKIRFLNYVRPPVEF